jgi:hypothetical protein
VLVSGIAEGWVCVWLVQWANQQVVSLEERGIVESKVGVVEKGEVNAGGERK